MSVQDTNPKTYDCNGSVTSFAAGFIDIESFGASALDSDHVIVTHWDNSEETETELEITTDYTIDDTNIVTVLTYPTDDRIVISPNYDYLQSFEFTASPFLDPGSLEIAVDKNTLNTQNLRNLVARSITVPITDDVVSLELPRVADRAEKFFVFDENGVPMAAGDASDILDFAQLEIDVALNNAHRVSVGTDHANVGSNNTHRGSDGTDHSHVVLNDTHRSSDGKNHSDVVLNNTHRASDGKNHADVVTNTSNIGTNAAAISNLIERYDTGWVAVPANGSATLITHNLNTDITGFIKTVFVKDGSGNESDLEFFYSVTGDLRYGAMLNPIDLASCYMQLGDAGVRGLTTAGAFYTPTQIRLILTKLTIQ
jgi:hypothetical protein